MEDSRRNNNKQQDDDEANCSIFLNDILGDRMTINEFFQNVWQRKSIVFTPKDNNYSSNNSYGGEENHWNDEAMKTTILNEIVHQGWNVLIEILHQSEREQIKIENQHEQQPSSSSSSPGVIEDHQLPLIFHNMQPLSREEVREVYGPIGGVFGPYLNGCSVVMNHADLLSPWIAAVCNDLQNSFPHAYANCYLTPPNSQAVPPHADDRDVLVVQLVGSKNWQVYQNMPVPYPYPHEQVGKDGIPVPQNVLNGPMTINTTLQPGDVLYMPRGCVHQAQCSNSLSFHITIALATHDWTLSGMMTMATKNILSSVIDYRRSILPIVNDNDKQILQNQIDDAFERIKKEVTADTILHNISTRIENHNRRAFPLRMQLIHRARFKQQEPEEESSTVFGNSGSSTKFSTSSSHAAVVGRFAAEKVTLDTVVRAATKEERDSVVMMMMTTTTTTAANSTTKPRGLNVREEIADSIISIVTTLKTNPSMSCRVKDFTSLVPCPNPMICDLSLLCLAKQSVELGAMAIVR